MAFYDIVILLKPQQIIKSITEHECIYAVE